MTYRQKFILEAIGLAVLVALIILLLFLLRGGREDGDSDEPSLDDIRNMPQVQDVFSSDIINNTRPSFEVNARIFAERFGSFSSESNFGNITDIQTIITPELAQRLNSLIASSANEITEQYYGVSTRVLVVEVLEQNETTARLKITTQRTEATGNVNNVSTRIQDLNLTMQLSGNNWLIADYAWQNN
jgi:hypothetical protein